MKKLISIFLCVFFALGCLASAEDSVTYTDVAQIFTLFHGCYLIDISDLEFNREYPLYVSSYNTGEEDFYNTPDDKFGVLFLADETGTCVSGLSIIARRSLFENEADNYLNTYLFGLHFNALMSPFIPEMQDLDPDMTNTHAAWDIIIDAAANYSSNNYISNTVRYLDMADIYARTDDSGIYIEITFIEPVSFMSLYNRMYLIESTLDSLK